MSQNKKTTNQTTTKFPTLQSIKKIPEARVVEYIFHIVRATWKQVKAIFVYNYICLNILCTFWQIETAGHKVHLHGFKFTMCALYYNEFRFVNIECNFWQFQGLQTTIFLYQNP